MYSKNIEKTIDALSNADSYKFVFHDLKCGEQMPSSKVLGEIVELLREIIFPGYFGSSPVRTETLKYYLGVKIDRVTNMLLSQIKRGLCIMNCSEGAS